MAYLGPNLLVKVPRHRRANMVPVIAAMLAPPTAFCVRLRSCRIVLINGAAANVLKKVTKKQSLQTVHWSALQSVAPHNSTESIVRERIGNLLWWMYGQNDNHWDYLLQYLHIRAQWCRNNVSNKCLDTNAFFVNTTDPLTILSTNHMMHVLEIKSILLKCAADVVKQRRPAF